ncbi:hypothetical protein OB2597_02917 [Pseudooceanicola batsensis HTCC2597]|uniref:Porin domain-containing protein n=2 Tax=Pseudooceanicola batsensis TaxID=314255 RepID=A3TXH7_PSEBH|nr:hypothetical protein OB2597_02917 [Pseudooceanicola batsensis HTCC2597]
MKHGLRPFGAAICGALALAAPAAEAQRALQGELSFELGRNQEKSRNYKHIATSLGTTFDNGVGLQLDLSVGKFESVISTQPAAAVHVYFAPGGGWALGAYLSGEDQRPGNYVHLGLEAGYDAGPFDLEAYAAYRDDRAASSDGSRYGIAAAYAPDSWNGAGLFGGGHVDEGLPGGDRSIAYLGTDYRFGNNTRLSLMAGRTDLSETVMKLSYSITFGDGPRFSRRDNMSTFGPY